MGNTAHLAGESFSDAETAAIIAGLRLLQRQHELSEDLTDIIDCGGERLDDDALDELCERINQEGHHHPDWRRDPEAYPLR